MYIVLARKICRLALLSVLYVSLGFACALFPREGIAQEVFELSSISSELEKLSLEERGLLKILFRHLFAEHELGYTLFGDKPMSFCFPLSSIIHISTKENFFKIYSGGQLPIDHAWKIWKKLPFQTENFLFIVYEKYRLPELIFLINKKQFVFVFNQNLKAFQDVYGPCISAESFLKDLMEKKIQPQELFRQHLLLGILLGYGRHNAELFQKREIFLEKSNLLPFWSFLSVREKEELGYLNRHLIPIYQGSARWMVVKPLCFVADPENEETQHLQKKYEVLHQKLTALFLSEDWIYSVVERLTSKNAE